MKTSYVAYAFIIALAAGSMGVHHVQAATDPMWSYPAFVPSASPNLSTQDMNALIAYIRSVMEWYRQDVLGQVSSSVSSSDTSDMTVRTDSATHVDDDHGTITGHADLNGSNYADVWFEYGTQSSNLSKSTSRIRMDDDEGDLVDFESKLTGLDDDRTYYYRAVARDDDGHTVRGSVKNFRTDDTYTTSDDSGDEPNATTRTADAVGKYSATLNGAVDMNDFNNGTVFFVYGTSKSDVADADSFDSYTDIDESGDDLRKEKVDGSLDGTSSYWLYVSDLDRGTRYYYAIGVSYEDDSGDSHTRLGSVRDFITED